tara:strand:- start:316 stop:552 length:237 start_codon:yes stop_codon:yes gene_type:complete
MNEEQFNQMMKILGELLESTQAIEDAVFDANFKEHNEKVEWNLWEIHNLAKIKFKGSENRPTRDAERTKEETNEASES